MLKCSVPSTRTVLPQVADVQVAWGVCELVAQKPRADIIPEMAPPAYESSGFEVGFIMQKEA